METIGANSRLDLTEDAGSVVGDRAENSEPKKTWDSPRLKEFGNLSFVVRGISYLPLDGLQNLTP